MAQERMEIGQPALSSLSRLSQAFLALLTLRNIAICAALLYAYSIIFSFSYASALTYVCPNHIGSMFKMAVDVADGLALYGQTYSQYGPVPTWIQALAITVFGRNVIVSAMTTMAFAFGTIFLLQLVWRRLLPLPYLLTAIILQAVLQPDNAMPWPNEYMGFFAAGTLLAIISYYESGVDPAHSRGMTSVAARGMTWAKLKLILAGLCTAGVILSRQQGVLLFVFVFLSMLAFLRGPHQTIKQRFSAAFLYAFGTALPLMIYLVYLQSRHMLVDFYKQTMLIIPVAYTSGNLSLQNHIHTLISHFFLADRLFFVSVWGLIALICFCYMAVLFLSRSLENPKARVIYLCAGFALVGMLNAYPLPDDYRYALGMAPATGVLIYLLYSMFSQVIAPIRFAAVLFVLYLLFTPDINYVSANYGGGIKLYKKDRLPGFTKLTVPSEIAGTYHPAVNEQFYTKFNKMLDAYMKLYPDTSFISLGVEPLFVTFVPHNKNAHQLPFMWWSKTGSMYDNGESQTINALLYPDFFTKLNDFMAEDKPLIYTYGQPVKGYKPIFENEGGVGFPLYWANQWIARPIVSIQAPIERANKFLASTDTKDFFSVPERINIAKVTGQSTAKIEAGHDLPSLTDSRLDTFISYQAEKPFQLGLTMQLAKAHLVQKISLYPRTTFEKLLPRYIAIAGSMDGKNWQPITASYSDSISATQPGVVFSFKPTKLKYVKISMNSLDYNGQQIVQIAQIILD